MFPGATPTDLCKWDYERNCLGRRFLQLRWFGSSVGSGHPACIRCDQRGTRTLQHHAGAEPGCHGQCGEICRTDSREWEGVCWNANRGRRLRLAAKMKSLRRDFGTRVRRWKLPIRVRVSSQDKPSAFRQNEDVNVTRQSSSFLKVISSSQGETPCSAHRIRFTIRLRKRSR